MRPQDYRHIALCEQCSKGFREAYEINFGIVPKWTAVSMLRPGHNY